MSRFFVVLLFVALISLSSSQSIGVCPSLIRIFNSYVTNATTPVDLILNGQTVVQNVFYGTGSRYFSVTPGSYNVVVQLTNTGEQVAQASFTAVPGGAYTVGVTGISTGPQNQVIFNSSPFIFPSRVFQPNANSFVGSVFRLEESSTTRNLMISKANYHSLVPQIAPKSATFYPDQVPGIVFFTVLTVNNQTVLNSEDQPETFNMTTGPGTIVDIFVYGDDNSTETAITVTVIQSTPSFDETSGCPLIDGSGIITPISPIYSYRPCAASTLSIEYFALILLAFLVAIF